MRAEYFFAQILESQDIHIPKRDNFQVDDFINFALIFIAAVAVLIIIVGGLKYIFAQGDPNRITEARNQVLYALIGLVITALAAAMVNFVLNRL